MIDADVLRAAGLTEAQIATVFEAAAPLIAELMELREYKTSRREQNRKDKQKQRSRQADCQADITNPNKINDHVRLTVSLTDPSPSLSSPPMVSPITPSLTPSLFPSLTDSPATKPLQVSDWPFDYKEQFWQTYPRKEEKKLAMAKLEAIRKTGLKWERFFGGLLSYAQHKVGEERQYIKQPTTWLNRGCWDDELKSNGEIFAERKLQAPTPRPIRVQSREEARGKQAG